MLEARLSTELAVTAVDLCSGSLKMSLFSPCAKLPVLSVINVSFVVPTVFTFIDTDVSYLKNAA